MYRLLNYAIIDDLVFLPGRSPVASLQMRFNSYSNCAAVDKTCADRAASCGLSASLGLVFNKLAPIRQSVPL